MNATPRFQGAARMLFAGAMLAALLLANGAAPATAHAGETEARDDAPATVLVLREEAYVRGPTVRLGDVADIQGEFEGLAAIADIELISAAMPGGSRHVNAALISTRLRGEGLDASAVRIEGARNVRATTMHLEVNRQMIAESLRRHIELEMPWDPAKSEIDVPAPMSDYVVPDGEVDIAWRANPNYRYVGPGAFRGTITVDGVAQQSFTLRAVVDTYGELVVATSEIARGRPLSPTDFEVRPVRLSEAPQGALTSLDEARNMVARRTIFPGQTLTHRHVEARRLIRRNQIVTVEMRVGSLLVQTQARALNDGRAGDAILLANTSSKEEFQGIVREDGVVIVAY